jgi:hypothetical protein
MFHLLPDQEPTVVLRTVNTWRWCPCVRCQGSSLWWWEPFTSSSSCPRTNFCSGDCEYLKMVSLCEVPRILSVMMRTFYFIFFLSKDQLFVLRTVNTWRWCPCVRCQGSSLWWWEPVFSSVACRRKERPALSWNTRENVFNNHWFTKDIIVWFCEFITYLEQNSWTPSTGCIPRYGFGMAAAKQKINFHSWKKNSFSNWKIFRFVKF